MHDTLTCMIEIPEFEYDYVTFERAETVVANGAFTRCATTVTRKKTPIHVRMLKRCVETEHGCWEWVGATDKRTGYGKIGSVKQGDMKYTHRVAASWFWLGISGDGVPTECTGLFGFKFPVPIKTHIHHECRNRKCVNPNHLYWMSATGNARVGGNDANSRKTGCPYGHGPYDKQYANGHRYCSKCKSEKEQRRRDRRRNASKID
jgi:hypothetical protein